MSYTQLLTAAQLASTREEAQKILKCARKMKIIENKYQERAFKLACK